MAAVSRLAVASKPPYDPVDLTSRGFWAQTAVEREKSYALLREKRPVSWQPPFEASEPAQQGGPGFWAVVRHADVVTVSRRHDVFSSGHGVLFEDIPEGLVEGTQSLLALDPPEHTRIRRLVGGAFTRRSIARLRERIEVHARQIVADLAAHPDGEAEFVEECASLLPMRVICDVLGVPPEQRDAVAAATPGSATTGGQSPGAGASLEALAQSARLVRDLAIALAAQRREQPADDLMTALVQAEADGERLTDAEIADLFALLCIAGNDTTRQTISHGLTLLTDLPEQRTWLLADFDGRIDTALDEILRYATPVTTFRRRAVTDTELGGRRISAGDDVVMFYASANRDEAVFREPEHFDLGRDPNPHLSFGGGGAHYCLAAELAKTQLRALFRELLHRLPDIEAGEPEYLTSSAVWGIKRLPCRFTPQGRPDRRIRRPEAGRPEPAVSVCTGEQR